MMKLNLRADKPYRIWAGLFMICLLLAQWGTTPAEGARAKKRITGLSTNDKNLLYEFLDSSRLQDKVGQYSVEQMARPHLLKQLKLSENDLSVVRNIIAGILDRDKMISSSRTMWIRNFNRRHASAASKWFATGAGQRVAQAELSALLVEEEEGNNRVLKLMEKNPPREDRLILIGKLENAWEAVRVQMAAQEMRVSILSPLNEKQSKANVKKSLADLKGKGKRRFKDMVLLNLHYVYHEVPDQDLENYAKFLQSSAGRWYVKNVNQWYLGQLSDMAQEGISKITYLVKGVRKGEESSALAQQVFQPGFRYLFTGMRDPFVPLARISKEEKNEEKIAKWVRVPEKKKIDEEKAKKPRLQKFGPELDQLRPIPYEVYLRLKNTNATLYNDLEYFAGLFKDRKELTAMPDQEYLEAVAFYKELIEKAISSKNQIVKTPLQTQYANLNAQGVVWNGFGHVALVETSDKAGHTVKKGIMLGPNFGKVQSIDEEKIVVLEQTRDFMGNVLSKTQKLEFFAASAEGKSK